MSNRTDSQTDKQTEPKITSFFGEGNNGTIITENVKYNKPTQQFESGGVVSFLDILVYWRK